MLKKDHEETNKALEDLEKGTDEEKILAIKRLKNDTERIIQEVKERIHPLPIGIYAEGFITSGPRKRHDEQDALGEDTCGFTLLKNKLLFWVLDGTSQLDKVRDRTGKELFSSRLLAQNIADSFPDLFLENNQITAEQLAKKAITLAQESWSNTLQKSQVILKKNSYQFGTTLIVGILDRHGSLDAYRIGDSSLALFGKDNRLLQQDSFYGRPKQKDNQFFVLKKNSKSIFIVDKNKAQGEHTYSTEVSFMTCFSDGVNSRLIDEILKIKTPNVQQLRTLIYDLSQNSEDDKSLVFAKIM